MFRLGNYQICGARPQAGAIPFYLEAKRPLGPEELKDLFESCRLVSAFVVKNAYPVLTKGCQDKIRSYIDSCKEEQVLWIGRYGQDKWFSMAETIEDTLHTVQTLKG